MARPPHRFWPWPAIAAVAWCSFAQAGYAATPVTNPAQYLDQTESLRTEDHPRFVQMLEQIHREASRLSAAEQWHLRYLDAWETMFQGDYAKSETQLRDVMEHSGNSSLIAKASAVLLINLATNRRYAEAFALASSLTTELPQISDPQIRFAVLLNLSQLMNLAGQTDLAIQYAHMMEEATPAGASPCHPLYLQVAALYNGKRITSASPQLHQAIETCASARQPVYTNALWLMLSSLYVDEGLPDKAIALLDRIDANIRVNHYYFQKLSAQVERAQAYAKLGQDNDAKKAALDAIAMSKPDDIGEWLRDAYEVLYRIEKKRSNASTALSYYEHYVAQDKGYLNEITARTLAYEVSQQHIKVQQLETEKLSKQNNILRLEQALNTKAVETGRLYIALLLLVVASIVFWLFRLKRSQLRFKKLSRHDGLTGIFNHQHFVSEADRALRLLEKKHGTACLISIDLDHFKQINDTHGHAMGDAVLRQTSATCQRQLRPTDLFGRLGGEEFGILLLDCPRSQGMAIADRIRLAIETTPAIEDRSTVSFSASVGLACTDTSGYGLQRLRREADAALYRAKRTGRNRVIADAGNDGMVEA